MARRGRRAAKRRAPARRRRNNPAPKTRRRARKRGPDTKKITTNSLSASAAGPLAFELELAMRPDEATDEHKEMSTYVALVGGVALQFSGNKMAEGLGMGLIGVGAYRIWKGIRQRMILDAAAEEAEKALEEAAADNGEAEKDIEGYYYDPAVDTASRRLGMDRPVRMQEATPDYLTVGGVGYLTPESSLRVPGPGVGYLAYEAP